MSRKEIMSCTEICMQSLCATTANIMFSYTVMVYLFTIFRNVFCLYLTANLAMGILKRSTKINKRAPRIYIYFFILVY